MNIYSDIYLSEQIYINYTLVQIQCFFTHQYKHSFSLHKNKNRVFFTYHYNHSFSLHSSTNTVSLYTVVHNQFLPDPRRAGLHEAFQFSFVRTSVCTSPIRSVVSYSANITRTPNIYTDSGPPIKRLVGGLIRGAPTPLTPPMGGPKYFCGGGLTN